MKDQMINNMFCISGAYAPTHRGSVGGGHGGQGNRYSYHENPANRYDGHGDFSSLPRDHRFLSWKRDLRPPPARRADIEGHEAVIRGHRRSFHYDDRKESAAYLTPGAAAQARPGLPGTSAGQREISPAAARRSYDCSSVHQFIEPCDR